MERRLAAILAADVVGYSRLMGDDEEATLATLNAYRGIIDGLVAAHRGRVTSLRERLIKTGARPVRHGRYANFQMAEAALPRQVFAGILELINGLRGPPFTAVSA